MAALLAGRALIFFSYDVRPRVLLAGSPREHLAERAELKPAWNLRNQWKLAWVALPLGVGLMLNALIGNSPRYSMEHYVGIRALGIFSAIATLMAIGTTFIEALGQATAPRLAKHYRSGDLPAFNALLRNLLLIGLLMGSAGVLVAAVFGKDILAILYSPEYAEQSELLVWLMGVMAVQYPVTFLGVAMTAARFFHAQMLFSAVGATVSIVSSFVLIPRFGVLGAAYTLMAVAIAQLCGRAATLVLAQRRAR
jgi:O-antigen/teichoic acid export membrane protein